MSDGFPIGAIIAFPGSTDPPSSQYWALCDGKSQSISGPYAPLFDVIGYANGGSGASAMFNLPDYRGRFLRGTANSEGNDPDSGSRTAMNPGGNTGDAVGSIQGYGTGSPVNKFKAVLGNLPNSSNNNASTAVGDDASAWNSGDRTVTFDGGDKETRPLNAYVLFYIKYTDVAP